MSELSPLVVHLELGYVQSLKLSTRASDALNLENPNPKGGGQSCPSFF